MKSPFPIVPPNGARTDLSGVFNQETEMPKSFYVAADSSGIPVSNRCLSFRGARKHCKRLRRRVAGVHVVKVAS